MSMFFLLLSSLIIVVVPSAFAGDPCEELPTEEERLDCYEREIEEEREKEQETNQELSDIRAEKNSVLGKINNLSSKISVTQGEINSLQADINEMSSKLDKISKALKTRKAKLDKKSRLRDKVLRDHYRTSTLSNLELFASFLPQSSSTGKLTGFQYSTFKFLFGETITTDATQLIKVLSLEIKSYKADKKEAESLKSELETAQANLLATKQQLDSQKKLVQENLSGIESEEGEVAGKLSDIQSEISKLSSKQQAIISAKSGEGYISGYEPAGYSLPDAPFSPAFAGMSYGAYTHYKGMSQYGAKGRADDGQDYKDIIKFYYDAGVNKKDDIDDNEICVQGYGDMEFRDYLYGIGEMPPSWDKEALKAQVVAARSYAYRYIKANKCICTSTSCQVFDDALVSRGDRDRWYDAVDDTDSKIIDKDTDSSGYGWYSPTAGGYINSIGWDEDGDWPGGAYENKADSPWFYKAWYTESYRNDSSTCGRSTPWLNKEEMADILNAWVVWRNGSSEEKSHISPVTTGCWGGDPYSNDEMKNKAEHYGEGYDSIDDIDVTISNGGYTSSITFDTDEGSVTLDGDEFKTVFNLRAPAYVAIRSRLFDIETD